MFWLPGRVYLEIFRFEWYLHHGQFNKIYERVRTCPVAEARPRAETQHDICRAVNLACIFYFKQVLCLQRAASTTCLLRKAGIPAQMVIGVQSLPFKAHAWVEVEGAIVNEKSYTPEMYSVLSRS
jgi:Transglutaminase-like superfamily